MNSVFANRNEEEEIFPLTVKEIAEAQGLDKLFTAFAIKEKYDKTLIENTPVFCKNRKLVIPQSLQHHDFKATTLKEKHDKTLTKREA